MSSLSHFDKERSATNKLFKQYNIFSENKQSSKLKRIDNVIKAQRLKNDQIYQNHELDKMNQQQYIPFFQNKYRKINPETHSKKKKKQIGVYDFIPRF